MPRQELHRSQFLKGAQALARRPHHQDDQGLGVQMVSAALGSGLQGNAADFGHNNPYR